jgi:hypothetical protein
LIITDEMFDILASIEPQLRAVLPPSTYNTCSISIDASGAGYSITIQSGAASESATKRIPTGTSPPNTQGAFGTLGDPFPVPPEEPRRKR